MRRPAPAPERIAFAAAQLLVALCIAQAVVCAQGRPKTSPQLPVPQAAIPMDTDSRAWTRDIIRAVLLGEREEEVHLMRRYERIDFATYDRLITNVKREREAYYKKWRDVRPDVGEQFAKIVNGRIPDKVQAKRKEYFDKYGAPKTATPEVPSEHGPSLDEVLRREALYSRFWQIVGWGAVFILGYFFYKFMGKGTKAPRPQEPEPIVSDTYGTADWAKRWKSFSPHPLYLFTGAFFGKSSHPSLNGDWRADPGAPVCSIPENHSIVIARTRTGKGTRVIVPTLLRYLGSMLVIDPKGENAAVTARARKAGIKPGNEFLVLILNPWGVLQDTYARAGFETSRYNPLEILDRNDPNIVANAQTLANTVCLTGGSDKDRFWQSSAANILAAVFLWITDTPGEIRTLGRARSITSLPRKQFTDDFLIPMAASQAFGGAIAELIGPYIDLANETYSGIMSNLSDAMKFMSDPQVKHSTQGNDFYMKHLVELPITVYVVIPPERMEAQRTWLRLILAAATMTFKHQPPGLRHEGLRCMFLLDEFASLGRIPNFTSDISSLSGHGVDFLLCLQTLSQLKEHYGNDGAQTILSNCAFKWFCNIGDFDTAKYLSDTLGKKTVQTIGRSESEGQSGSGLTSGESTTVGETGRNLLNPDEIMNLGRDIAILLNPLGKPQYLRTVDYWNAPAVFQSMEENYPHYYRDTPLWWDDNPYVPSSRR